jgi:hypothetical protein
MHTSDIGQEEVRQMLGRYISYARIWWIDLGQKLNQERALELIEWIGIAAVALALIGVLVTTMGGEGGERIANAVVDTIVGWLEAFRGGE